MRYRILYTDSEGTGRYWDLESNGLAAAVWAVAKELCGSGELVDTMILPCKETSLREPTHVNLYPNWQQDE